MPKQGASVKATVFIPTYNGEEYLPDILKMLFRQKVSFDFEVLIIDSGSTDDTMNIIARYQKSHKNLKLHEIPNTEFGHGKTRNLAAQMANGEFIVYLSHDAIPAHDRWLTEMLAPFAISDKVKAVLGKQDPRRFCFPLMKYDIQNVFRAIGSDHGTTLYMKPDNKLTDGELDFLGFYSDVNSATRRDFLLKEIPYQDVPYSEDQLFGKDVIRAGYIKAYAPKGNVVHSNDVTLGEYRMRMFDETIGLRKTGHTIVALTPLRLWRHMASGAVKDSIRILRDGQYSRKRKLYWLVLNPLYHVQRWRGYNLAARFNLSDESANEHSLEASRKS